MAPGKKEYRLFGLNLWQQVVIGMVLGIVTGVLLKEHASSFEFLGKIFFTLIKMVVSPLIFLLIVAGVTSTKEQGGSVARLAGRVVISILCLATIAVTIGVLCAAILQPGVGMSEQFSSLLENAKEPEKVMEASLYSFFMQIFPDSGIGALADNRALQVVFFALCVGGAINLMPADKTRNLRAVIQEGGSVMVEMMGYIVYLSPLAVFGFMSHIIGQQGLSIVVLLAYFMFVVVLGLCLHALVLGGAVGIIAKKSPLLFFTKMREMQLIAFATASSKAALKPAMDNLHNNLGVSKRTVNFILPLASSINLDGTALYVAVGTIFGAQLFGIDLSFYDYLLIIVTSTLGSLGGAGVPGAAVVLMQMTYGILDIPLVGIAVILGVDRFLDMCRTVLNVTGDAAISVILDTMEGTIDTKRYYEPLK